MTNPYGEPPAYRSQRGLAITSLVLSFLMCGLISFVMALVALVRASPHKDTGRSIAITAMITSFVMPAVLVVLVAVFGRSWFETTPVRDASGQVTQAATVDKDDLRVGDCLVDPELMALDEQESTTSASLTVEVRPCSMAHDFEVLAEAQGLPTDEAGSPASTRSCQEAIVAEFSGPVRALRGIGLSIYGPQDDGRLLCLGYRLEGGHLVGHLADG